MTQLRVHVAINSGMPDPFVDLDEDASAAVLEALVPDRELGNGDLGLPPPWHLGYRGLLVEQLVAPDPRLPLVFEFGTDALRGRGLAHRVAASLTDERLLGAGGPIGALLPDWLVEVLPDFLDAARAAPRTVSDRVDVAPTPCGDEAPEADLWWWSDLTAGYYSRQWHNNCYNYATNQRTDTFAQPGWASGLTLDRFNLAADRVHLYAWYDNLYDAPAAENTCPPVGHLVAAAFDSSLSDPDYHWWRKNRDGYWTHKPGRDTATGYDFSGKAIIDPYTSDRGRYTEWIGFMVVVPGHVRIGGSGTSLGRSIGHSD